MTPKPLASGVLTDWPGPVAADTPLVVGYLTGEGIGAEVMPVALAMLGRICEQVGQPLELHAGGAIGLPAVRECGRALSEDVHRFCSDIFARGGTILCGPGGGRFVYELRAAFDLYCKLTPLRPLPAMQGLGPLQARHAADVDILAVRDNIAGLYFGTGQQVRDAQGRRCVEHRFRYADVQVERLLDIAFAAAAARRGRLCVTLKPGGVPAVSQLWREIAELRAQRSRVHLSFLEIDNAVYQLLAEPQAFDVIASPNMFGDVLADAGALLLGSRGCSCSGNFGPGGRAVYQTGHGAAHDIAGKDRANPVGQILAVAMMLRESFGLTAAATRIEAAIDTALRSGARTADIPGQDGEPVLGTRAMGQRLLAALEAGA